jgi:hypothetical protein
MGPRRAPFVCYIVYAPRARTHVHSDFRTVSSYWVLPVFKVELIRAVWADDGDRPLLF